MLFFSKDISLQENLWKNMRLEGFYFFFCCSAKVIMLPTNTLLSSQILILIQAITRNIWLRCTEKDLYRSLLSFKDSERLFSYLQAVTKNEGTISKGKLYVTRENYNILECVICSNKSIHFRPVPTSFSQTTPGHNFSPGKATAISD